MCAANLRVVPNAVDRMHQQFITSSGQYLTLDCGKMAKFFLCLVLHRLRVTYEL